MYFKGTSTFPSKPLNNRTLPRILCLHGGGVNAAIFEAQSRALVRHLQHSFRFVWADAPYFCDPHPDVVGVYGSYAPFRRWLRWLPEHPDVETKICIEDISYAIRSAIDEDEKGGGTGDWVGLMGFSQGAKLAASLLLEQQARELKAKREGHTVDAMALGVHWKFGIFLAGSAPLNNLNPEVLQCSSLVGAGGVAEDAQSGEPADEELLLKMPTLHVHGMADPGLCLHQRVLHEYCQHGSTTLIEWDGTHRVPIKWKDVVRVVTAIYDLADSIGVKVTRTV